MSDNGPDYSRLMSKRIKRILLVCNNYDSYALEEDGPIEAQITQEYSSSLIPFSAEAVISYSPPWIISER